MNRGQFRTSGLHWRTLIIALVALVPWAHVANAQTRSSADAQLRQRLEQRVTLAWQGQQLAPALDRLANSQRILIWIDRRVDPTTPVEFSAIDQPLFEALTAVAAPHDWGVTPFHGVLYVGPRQTAEELQTLSALARQALAKAPAETRALWLKLEPWSFPRLSEPRQLLHGLARSVGAQLQDDQRVPHDLSPARSLPPMSTIDRLVLLLSGFDLTCEISADGRQARIVPIARPVQLTASYSVTRARSAAVDAALAAMPTVSATRRGQKLTLVGRVEDHQRLRDAMNGQRPLASSQPRPSAPSKSAQRFTLKITNQPAGRVIDQLAQQLKLEVKWDPSLAQNPAAGRDAIVSCDVSEADLDALLTAVLSPAGLAFERDEQQITIRRAY